MDFTSESTSLQENESRDDIPHDPPDRGLYKWGTFDDDEEREDYCAGGFHPVHLDDEILDTEHDRRYRVIHKLGNGGGATVWLCRHAQTGKLVALKILMADLSRDDCADVKILEWLAEGEGGGGDEEHMRQHLATPLEHFWISGPNGRHMCLVLPVLGPKVESVWTRLEEPEKVLPKLAFKACQGLALLHRRGICHGDFRPSNVLLRLSSLDHLGAAELYSLLGTPEKDPVILAGGGTPGPEAPKYVVRPVDFQRLETSYLTDDIRIIDFGESFKAAHPREELGIPTAYSSPELFFDDKASEASDVWALGCAIFEIVTGRKLFLDMFGDGEDVVLQWVQLLGRMPDCWWGKWERRGRYFDDQGNPLVLSDDGREGARKYTWEDYMGERLNVTVMPGKEMKTLGIPENERDLITGLLSRILRYDPGERLGIAEILEHEYWERTGMKQ